jgi:hypothetical protein
MPFKDDVELPGWNVGPHMQNVWPPKALDDATRANQHTTALINANPSSG